MSADQESVVNFVCINRHLSTLLAKRQQQTSLFNWQEDWHNGKIYNWLVLGGMFSQTMTQQPNANSLTSTNNSSYYLQQQQQQQNAGMHTDQLESPQRTMQMDLNGTLKKANQSRKRHRRDAISHLFLNGGLATVPMESIEIFNTHYADDVKSGRCLMVSEQRTSIYRWCCDLDIKHSRSVVMNIDTMAPYLQIMSQCLKSFYGYLSGGGEGVDNTTVTDSERDILSVTFRLIVCQTPTRILDEQTCKTGFHVYAPNLYVNDEIAKMFRKTILYRIAKQFSEVDNAKLFLEPWYKIFDEQIYKTNGLRMVGSYKCVECRYCPKIAETSLVSPPTTPSAAAETAALLFCKTCYNRRQLIDVNSMYVPVAVLDGFDSRKRDTGVEKEIDVNLLYLIKETSIRSIRSEPEPPFIQPEESDMFPLGDIERLSEQQRRLTQHYQQQQQQQQQKNGKGGGGASQRKSGPTEHDWITLFSTDVEFQQIQKLIRSLSHYDQLTVQQVYREEFKPKYASNNNSSTSNSGGGGAGVAAGQPRLQVVYTVHVFGPTHQRRFCQNINRVHNSVNIWFKLSNRMAVVTSNGSKSYQPGIAQRCFCKCAHTDTTSGLRCSQYSSPVIPTSQEDNDILYGHLVSHYAEVVDKLLTKIEKTQAATIASSLSSSSTTSSTTTTKTNQDPVDSIMKFSSYALDLFKPITKEEIQSINIQKQNMINVKLERKRKNERKKTANPLDATQQSPTKKNKRS